MNFRKGLCWTKGELRTNVQKLLTLVEMSSNFESVGLTARSATSVPW